MGCSNAGPTLDESGERSRRGVNPLYRCGIISASAKWRGGSSVFGISHLDPIPMSVCVVGPKGIGHEMRTSQNSHPGGMPHDQEEPHRRKRSCMTYLSQGKTLLQHENLNKWLVELKEFCILVTE
jgi:hypothetical protein